MSQNIYVQIVSYSCVGHQKRNTVKYKFERFLLEGLDLNLYVLGKAAMEPITNLVEMNETRG